MSIQVNIEKEEVSSYERTKLSAESIVPGVMWKAKFTQKQLDDMKELIVDRIHQRLKYEHRLLTMVWEKMTYTLPKQETFEARMLKGVDEILAAFVDKLKGIMELHKIKPVQKSIAESTDKKK